jgi:enamine deaminase RidA (YjgF/YER057c/UK114 family)
MYKCNNLPHQTLNCINQPVPLKQSNNAFPIHRPPSSHLLSPRPAKTQFHFLHRRRNLQSILLLQHNRAMEPNVPSRRHPLHGRYARTLPIIHVRNPNAAHPKLTETHIGMRGIHRSNSTLTPTGLPRVRKAYENMRDLAELAGAELNDCVRLVVYTTDMYRYRPMCNEVQVELWGTDSARYPPRTIIEVGRLNDDDIVEVEGTFHNPKKD